MRKAKKSKILMCPVKWKGFERKMKLWFYTSIMYNSIVSIYNLLYLSKVLKTVFIISCSYSLNKKQFYQQFPVRNSRATTLSFSISGRYEILKQQIDCKATDTGTVHLYCIPKKHLGWNCVKSMHNKDFKQFSKTKSQR